MAGFDKKIIDKWSPLVDKHLNIKNTYFKYLCCHYFEYHKIKTEDISEIIVSFREKIGHLDNFKIEIKKEYINLLTGRKEYLLVNGMVFDPESFDVFLTTKELVDIFGIEFITHLDPTISRDVKINQLLNNDDRQ
jgi:hypothetical protein